MNERIKLLAEQADFFLESDNEIRKLEKFAELIVAECIQVLKDTGYPNAHGNCVGVEELKQHFELNEIKPPA